MNYRFLVILPILFISVTLAQNADTSAVPFGSVEVQPDTLLQDSTAVADTLAEEEYDLDAVVFANAEDSLTFDITNRKMYIYGKGEIKYKNTELKSGEIAVDFETSDLMAEGIVDSADTLTQTPSLTEDGETYEGSSLQYNFESKRGYISLAKNKQEGSRYEGEKVKKVSEDTYFIEDGIYTTCSEDPPHTHFTAEEMKVIQNDKIFAKWVFMHIAGIPLPLPLPFAVFPNKTGRRSGIIVPGYGETADRGQYFTNFGYFFAFSDYYDLALTGDYYTKGGYGLNGRFRYNKRYDFQGSIEGNYAFQKFGEEGDPGRNEVKDWRFSMYHNQQIDPTMSLNANLRFQSKTYTNNVSTSISERLDQNIYSTATLSKRWSEAGMSMTVNYNRNQDLRTGDITEDLPNITFNKTRAFPFKREGVSASDQQWYEKIGYSYSSRLRNNRRSTDTSLTVKAGVIHNISISAPLKVSYFSINPSFNYEERWYNQRLRKENFIVEEMTDDGVVLRDSTVDNRVDEFNFVRSFNFSLSANTKLYGMYQPNMFGIEAFRHTLTPTISYRYTPDFSDDVWGNTDSYVEADGTLVEYDIYGQEIFGGAGAGETQSINFSLGNVFEMKTMKDPTDTTSKSEKIQLLNANASLGYNFAADKFKLSDLSVSYRTQIAQLLQLSANTRYTFYAYEGRTRVNRYLASEGRGLFRLTNLTVALSTSLSGDRISGENRRGERDEYFDPETDTFGQRDNYQNLYEEREPDFSIPWQLGLNFNYNLNRSDPNAPIKSANLGMNLSTNVTKNWKVDFSGSYDIVNDVFAAPRMTVYRDLHCWEMDFSWIMTGPSRGFRFEIRMKAPELRDIKVEKSSGLYSGRR